MDRRVGPLDGQAEVRENEMTVAHPKDILRRHVAVSDSHHVYRGKAGRDRSGVGQALCQPARLCSLSDPGALDSYLSNAVHVTVSANARQSVNVKLTRVGKP